MWIQPHFLKCVKHVPSLQSFRSEESCFSCCKSQGGESFLKLIKVDREILKTSLKTTNIENY